jgi:flagellar basal-body rod modification protein FlgD
MAAAGLIHHSTAAPQALAGPRVTPMASSTTATTGTGNSDSSSATISANDFLTLLVTEMQNQDPTANTDPNEYINQLVNVNSLEQLININQTLSTALGGSTPNTGASQAAMATSNLTGTSPAGSTAQGTTDRAAESAISGAQPAASGAGSATAIQALVTRFASGNLSVPTANPAAQRLAHALDGRSIAGALPAAQ